MRVPFVHVDSFTDRTFAGNPAAVCLLPSWPEDGLLLDIAAEAALSETAFVVAEAGAPRIRWFTPRVEVPLCGHGTLAAAHVLLGRTGAAEVVFRSLSGDLRVRRDGDRYELDFPALAPWPCQAPVWIAGALGAVPDLCLENERSHVAVFADAAAVRALRPDMEAVERLPRPYLIATAPGDDCDFVSRFFAPAVGVPEDPVTGSAHCVLTPYWAQRLGRKRLHARQVSRRGGELWCEDRDGRVGIAGRAVTVIEGELLLPE